MPDHPNIEATKHFNTWVINDVLSKLKPELAGFGDEDALLSGISQVLHLSLYVLDQKHMIFDAEDSFSFIYQ